MTVTVRLTAATEPLFTGAATLFDEYRQHYGANPAPEAVAAWMLEQVLSMRARIYVACSENPAGTSGLGIPGDEAPRMLATARSLIDASAGADGMASGTGDRKQARGPNGSDSATSEYSGASEDATHGTPVGQGRGPVAYGICSVAVVPAALTLRTVWLVRDLFVVPAARHRGVARALLAHVAREARAAGAHRLSLQTETSNVRAIELYAKNGFDVLTDVAVMDRPF